MLFTDGDKIFEDLFTKFSVFYFWMELNTIEGFFCMVHGLNGAIFTFSKMRKVWGEFGDFVMM